VFLFGDFKKHFDNASFFAAELKRIKNNSAYQSKLLGKDTSFDFPPSVKLSNLHHCHIRNLVNGNLSYTSDRYLVYVQSFKNPNLYAILGVIEPPAHDLTKTTGILQFYEAIAENFHSQM
jgi:hypothetical protein